MAPVLCSLLPSLRNSVGDRLFRAGMLSAACFKPQGTASPKATTPHWDSALPATGCCGWDGTKAHPPCHRVRASPSSRTPMGAEAAGVPAPQVNFSCCPSCPSRSLPGLLLGASPGHHLDTKVCLRACCGGEGGVPDLRWTLWSSNIILIAER